MKKMTVELTLNEEMLGTASSNKTLQKDFISSKAPDAQTMEEEVAAVGASVVAEKATTVFPKDEQGRPFVYDYQIKGFFKDACSMLARVPDTKSQGLKAFKKTIDGLIFPKPRRIMLELPGGAALGGCERPLRASTPQGERVALASSETVPEGTKLRFEVLLMDPKLEGLVKEWMDYGELRGLGQWRNSGKGRFSWKEV